MKNKIEKLKIAVLLLTVNFLAGHSKAGKPTEFSEAYKNKIKLHTMRENYEYWAAKAEQINAGKMELSIRQWMGKPYNSHQNEIARLQHVHLQRFEMYWYKSQREKGELPTVCIDGKIYTSVRTLAANDGLELEDWLEWFFKKKETVSGCIIHFTDFKY
jgi:hypothetical protein